MFKYVGNMHGNEAIGRQLLIYLAEFLARHYDRDNRVANLLNNTEIFLLPSLNPDGYDRATEGECSGTDKKSGARNEVNIFLITLLTSIV